MVGFIDITMAMYVEPALGPASWQHKVVAQGVTPFAYEFLLSNYVGLSSCRS